MKRALCFLLFFLVACGPAAPEPTPLKPIEGTPPDGTIITDDGHTIAYDMYENKGKPGIILLHMLGRDRHDWPSLARWLQNKGFAVVAIDFRGHGQSTGNRAQFSPADYNAMTNDVLAAKTALALNGADVSELFIIGASIGANVGLRYAAQDIDVAGAVLLSPGRNYQGVSIGDISTTTPLLVAYSQADTQSANSIALIEDQNPQTQLHHYENAGHGTNLFQQQDLAPTILAFLQEQHNI